MNFKLLKVTKRILFHVFFWFLIFAFFYAFFSVGSKNKSFIFWFSTLLSVIAIVASYSFIYQLLPNYLLLKKYRTFILYTFYAIVLITFAVLMTVVFGFVFFYNLEYQTMPALTKNSGVILVCVFFIIALTSGLQMLRYNYRTLEKQKTLENKFLQTQLQLKEQELKFLKMQIHPHFLFNTLNTLYGFALKKSDKTPNLILKMSNLLDYILYQVDKPLVLLKDEITHINNYISLEKSRFQDSLTIQFSVDDFDDDIQIPPMLLLPFVENAFKHGTQENGILKVIITLKLNDGFLEFDLENTSKKTENSTNGIGLTNIKKRLKMIYNDTFTLLISNKNALFAVHLKIPF